VFEGILLDIRYCLRALWRTPAFTFMVIVVIALGIGLNTALFTIAYWVVLKLAPLEALRCE
jgi:putative ABC transport system permease protein